MIHHGGKIGRAASKLAKRSTPKKAKSRAGATMARHKAKMH